MTPLKFELNNLSAEVLTTKVDSLTTLNHKESELLGWKCVGAALKQAAEFMGNKYSTVKNYNESLSQKLEANNTSIIIATAFAKDMVKIKKILPCLFLTTVLLGSDGDLRTARTRLRLARVQIARIKG